MEIKSNRKNFFEKIGKASLFVAFGAFIPQNLFGSNKKLNKKVKVEIHPSAVKRINKV
jgi:hypothetical protein